MKDILGSLPTPFCRASVGINKLEASANNEVVFIFVRAEMQI